MMVDVGLAVWFLFCVTSGWVGRDLELRFKKREGSALVVALALILVVVAGTWLHDWLTP